MDNNGLDKLAALIMREPDALLSQWREQVRKIPSAEHLDGLLPKSLDTLMGL